ncbi:MAG: NADH-quinone oxidoreductase subunit K [Candidatus Dormibacteria bacterium]
MSVGPAAYLVLSAILFGAGTVGVVARRQLVASLASLSILFAAPLVGAAGVSDAGYGTLPHQGDAIGAVIVVSLCAQLAVGGALAALVYRRSSITDSDSLSDVDA